MSQNKILDSIYINKISKNILIYRIANYNFNIENECRNNIGYNSDYLLPNKDEYIELFALREDKFKYPKGNYILYSVYNINNLIFKKINDTINKIKTSSHGDTFDMLLSKRYLIGIEKKRKEIKYLSGFFFKDCIAHDFNLKEDTPETFYEFLKIKLSNYSISKVSFLKKRKTYLIFRAYAKTLNSDILIKIDRKNYDSIQVKEIKLSWTENGSYKWKK